MKRHLYVRFAAYSDIAQGEGAPVGRFCAGAMGAVHLRGRCRPPSARARWRLAAPGAGGGAARAAILCSCPGAGGTGDNGLLCDGRSCRGTNKVR